ncbi:MAG: hypothetical protein HQL50_15760 [Magnetococcales bacterium]|nr:hypothetical protein [Magnetococcales bacterium]
MKMKPEYWIGLVGLAFMAIVGLAALVQDEMPTIGEQGSRMQFAALPNPEGAGPAIIQNGQTTFVRPGDPAPPVNGNRGPNSAMAGMAIPDEGLALQGGGTIQGVALQKVGQPRVVGKGRVPNIKPKPGMTPFENAPTTTFSGTVQQITELPQRDGQIHIWVQDDQKNIERQVSIAPSWFLSYMWCEIRHDQAISGKGFEFDRGARSALIYARWIVVDGKTCHLRNDEGFALWSSRLR